MSNEQTYTTRIPDFTSSSPVNDTDVDQVANSHREMIKDLIGQLRDETISMDGSVYVIYLLGELRATLAVSILIEKIDLKAHKVDPKAGIGRWGAYPAQEALAKIGNPAVNMIIDMLPTEGDELRRKLMCFVIKDVDGEEIGKLRVENKRKEVTNASQRANLDRALVHF